MEGNKSWVQKVPTTGSSCPVPSYWQRADKIHSTATLSLQNAVEVGLNIFLICAADWARRIDHFRFSTSLFWKYQCFRFLLQPQPQLCLPGQCCL